MAELRVPPSIDDLRSQALSQLASRLQQLDLVPLLVYRIDSVPAQALPLLAWQFDALSPLWQAVAPAASSVDALTNIDELVNIDTLTQAASGGQTQAQAIVAAQRSLIKAAIRLHRYRGTPWVIKKALAALGWSNVAIVEGQHNWGGTQYPPNQGWAVFRVMVQLEDASQLNASSVDTAAAAIDFFKPARSWLDSLWFELPPVNDGISIPLDQLSLGGIAEYSLDAVSMPSDSSVSIRVALPVVSETYNPVVPSYDAHYRHSGVTYGAAEPAVADSALIMNGNAILQGG